MWWYLLQSSIIFAAAASNIRYHWTPNPYVVGLIGVGLHSSAKVAAGKEVIEDFARR
jgi:hypothetical protein